MIKLTLCLFLTATMVAASLGYEGVEDACEQERGKQIHWNPPASERSLWVPSEDKLEIFVVVGSGLYGCCGRWDVTNLKTEEGKPLWPSIYALGAEKVGAGPFKAALLDAFMQTLIRAIDSDSEELKAYPEQGLISLKKGSRAICREGGWIWHSDYRSAYSGKPFVYGSVRLNMIPGLLTPGSVLSENAHPLREGFYIDGFPEQSDGYAERPYWR